MKRNNVRKEEIIIKNEGKDVYHNYNSKKELNIKENEFNNDYNIEKNKFNNCNSNNPQ